MAVSAKAGAAVSKVAATEKATRAVSTVLLTRGAAAEHTVVVRCEGGARFQQRSGDEKFSCKSTLWGFHLLARRDADGGEAGGGGGGLHC